MKPLKLSLSLALLASALSSAFGVQLTADQQAKLNALPPGLRAQAMEELRKVQDSQLKTSRPLDDPQVVVPAEGDVDSRTEQRFNESTDLAKTEDEAEARAIDQELKQFGYDLFAGAPTTFAPATVIPVPSDYAIGPGDQVRIQFFGKQSASYDLYVSRDGVLQVPELGPITVAGQSFSELKADKIGRASCRESR